MMDILMAMLAGLGDDVSYSVCHDEVTVTLEDFAGFDSHWEEVEREYDDPDAVDAFLAWLDSSCVSSSGDFYQVFHFDGFDVVLGYASYDI